MRNQNVTLVVTASLIKSWVESGRGSGMPVGDGMRLNRVGGNLVWQWPFTCPISGGKTKATYGRWPGMGLSLAREAHRQQRAAVASGINPLLEKRAERAARRAAAATVAAEAKREVRTVSKLVHEYMNAKSKDVAGSTWKGEFSRLSQHALPFIGDIPIADLKRGEVFEKVIDPLLEKGLRVTARRICSSLRQAIDRGVARDWVTVNVLDGKGVMKQIPRAVPRRHPSIPPAQAAALARAMQNYGGADVTKACAFFFMLFFNRTAEIVKLRWDELRMLHGVPCILIGSAAEGRLKMGKARKLEAELALARGEDDPHAFAVPLPRQAVAVLERLKEVAPVGNPFVFASPLLPKKPISSGTVYQMLRTLGYEGRMCQHGFRRLGRTMLAEKGFNEKMLEAQLHHSQPGIEWHYNDAKHVFGRLEILQWWADELDRFAAGADADVIPLKSALPPGVTPIHGGAGVAEPISNLPDFFQKAG